MVLLSLMDAQVTAAAKEDANGRGRVAE